MKSLRRYYARNTPYFITVVTKDRRPTLLDHIDVFWYGWEGIALDAWVILPDHFHAILIPDPDTISVVLRRFKLRYGHHIEDRLGARGVFQHRFWDHIIRDRSDLNRHLDYIHFNPVHHRLVSDPFLHTHSSLPKWFADGYYQRDWGTKEITFEPLGFGE